MIIISAKGIKQCMDKCRLHQIEIEGLVKHDGPVALAGET